MGTHCGLCEFSCFVSQVGSEYAVIVIKSEPAAVSLPATSANDAPTGRAVHALRSADVYTVVVLSVSATYTAPLCTMFSYSSSGEFTPRRR